MMSAAKLGETDRRILEAVAKGFHTFADIADLNIMEAAAVAMAVEDLEIDGYVRRRGYTGFGFNEIDLTDRGRGATVLSDKDKEALKAHGVSSTALEVLKFIRAHPGTTVVAIAESLRESAIALVPHCNALISAGLVQDGGVWRRTFTATAKGQQVAR